MKRTRFIAAIAAALIAGFVLGGIGISAAATRTAAPAPQAAGTRMVASSPTRTVTPGPSQMATGTPAPRPSQMATGTPAPRPTQKATGTPAPRKPRTTVRSTYCAPQQSTTTTQSQHRDCDEHHDGTVGTSRCGW